MKKFLIASVVLATIVTVSAFTSRHKAPAAKPLSEQWFLFVGGAGEEGNPAKYQLMDPQPSTPPCSAPISDLCAILIEPDGSGQQPDLANNSASQTRYKP